ncbi:RRM domain-containing protein [Caenorhabditis elegans]|uniref:RRM domain-containing protein n=1 Tax=Caenorhabditis elegans TaxID=6239 RepID=Q9TZI2_CAEEL|nr:RRM domain-containing protein [Caenorhabditis elegans]CCD66241.1 RRM domain-containing protein [Caenorhabditis elegans]|eukprot:NP_491976.2 Zinc finger putative Transcription Factor family [Caenorhabditis elegans]
MSAEYGQYGYYGGAGGAQTTTTPAAALAASIPATSVYGEQRPTFSEDGTGAPYSTILNLVGSAAVNSDISYDTSSKDPHMIRARVFIGNIARAIITRDDIIELFRPFGKIIAVNYFAQQGFGFVQFNEAGSADESCRSLNGMSWKACCLDVHLAMLGSLRKPTGNEGRQGNTIAPAPLPVGKPLTQHAVDTSAQSAKRPYEDEEYEIFKQNKRNKQFANGDTTINEQLAPNEMCDTMVCGYCRFVTSDFEEFKEHRIAGCNKYKDPEEPRHRLKCATCSQRFLGAWGLLEHLTDFHRMLLYTEEKMTPNDLAQMRGGSVSTPSSIPETPASGSAAPAAPNSANSTPSHHIVEGAPLSYSSNNGTPQI